MITEDQVKAQIKSVEAPETKKKDFPNFHVTGLHDDILVDLHPEGLDDIAEFNCSMYNFGEMEDLPESDRKMLPKDQICKDYRS